MNKVNIVYVCGHFTWQERLRILSSMTDIMIQSRSMTANVQFFEFTVAYFDCFSTSFGLDHTDEYVCTSSSYERTVELS